MRICVDSPIPTIEKIIQSILNNLHFPPSLPDWPNTTLPSLPIPLFPNFHLPNMEMIIMGLELQATQLQQTLLNMVKPMLNFLGMALDTWLPKIEGLGITILDLLMGTPDKIVTAIKNAIERGFRWPSIPWPLFPKAHLPSMETIRMLQHIVADYM